jgi:hypothetical protein
MPRKTGPIDGRTKTARRLKAFRKALLAQLGANLTPVQAAQIELALGLKRKLLEWEYGNTEHNYRAFSGWSTSLSASWPNLNLPSQRQGGPAVLGVHLDHGRVPRHPARVTCSDSLKATGMAAFCDIHRVATDEGLLGKYYAGDTWRNWRVVLDAAFGRMLRLGEDRRIFAELAGGRAAPRQPIKELWCVAGRRSGKDSVAALLVTRPRSARALRSRDDSIRMPIRAPSLTSRSADCFTAARVLACQYRRRHRVGLRGSLVQQGAQTVPERASAASGSDQSL